MEWLDLDLSQPLDRKRLPTKLDAIIHLAQSVRYKDFPSSAGDMFRVNVASTAELIDYAYEAGVRKFLFTSTGTVYEPFNGNLAESDSVAPRSYYAATKLAAETLLKPYSDLVGVCVMRMFALYGPNQRDRLVPDLHERIRSGRAVTLAGRENGLCLPLAHVDDAVDLIITAIDEGWDGTINVATPEVVCLRALAEAIGAALGRAPIFEVRPNETPIVIRPNLAQLAARYDLSTFRPMREGIRAAFQLSS